MLPRQPRSVRRPRQAAVKVRYKPMSLPSAPFWLILIAAVVFITIIMATWSVVFMFAIGVALFAVLLPVVNWIARRGVPRGLASLLVVAVTVIIAILVGLFALAIYFNQFMPFITSIPERLTEIQANAPVVAVRPHSDTPRFDQRSRREPGHGDHLPGLPEGRPGPGRNCARPDDAAVLRLLSAHRPAADVARHEGRHPGAVAALCQGVVGHLHQRLRQVLQGGDRRRCDPGHDGHHRRVHHRLDRRRHRWPGTRCCSARSRR